jgi:hypothetical protein
MWLFDAEVYTNMSTLNEATAVTDRGMSLHKVCWCLCSVGVVRVGVVLVPGAVACAVACGLWLVASRLCCTRHNPSLPTITITNAHTP